MIDKLIKGVKNPRTALLVLWSKTNTDRLPDEKFLKTKFFLSMGKKLDLENPKTFNEKLQWIKLYDRNPLYTKLVDKYLVRDYIKDVLGEEYLIPLIGAWDSPDDIDFDALPDKFVLKCNHNSGLGMCICKDKSKLDIQKVKEELRKGMAQDYYLFHREWPYKDVPKKIIAEKYMTDESGYELKDYKFFCFDGKVKMFFVAKDREVKGVETKFDFFDADYNHLPFTNGHPNSEPPYFKPDGFEKMKAVAEKLSKGLPEVRVDLYNINGQIYFGEMTFFHWSGFTAYEPEEWDYKLGSYLKLPQEKNEGNGTL